MNQGHRFMFVEPSLCQFVQLLNVLEVMNDSKCPRGLNGKGISTTL